MPTGKYELDGRLLPGTTTIIGKFKKISWEAESIVVKVNK